MIEANSRDQILDAFFEYLSLILSHYNNLIPVLKEELQLIIHGDIKQLDENLKQQQVLLIQTKTFDKQVGDFSQKMGIHANTLTELALQLEPPQQIRFFSLLTEFEITVRQISFYKEKCRLLLQSKLFHLDKLLAYQDSSRENTTYDKNAWEIQGNSSNMLFEKKI